MSPCHGEDRQFKSDRGRHFFAQVAQSVEQGTENPRVGGSIPSLSTKSISYAVVAEWQTRYFEGVVNVSSYGFKSHQPHQNRNRNPDRDFGFFLHFGK